MHHWGKRLADLLWRPIYNIPADPPPDVIRIEFDFQRVSVSFLGLKMDPLLAAFLWTLVLGGIFGRVFRRKIT